MSQLTIVDAALREQLKAARGAIEFVDEDGRKLGQFTPEPFCPWDPTLTGEEIDRQIRESKGSTLAEIWQRLGAK